MANRPLSPHLSIWRWGAHMMVSILHRASGDGMATVGLAVLLWWLAAMAGGAESYQTFTDWMWADLSTLEWSGAAIIGSLVKLALKVVLVGLTWAFFQHMCSGLRHFVLDTGAGYELDTNRNWSWGAMAGGVLLTAATWAYILLR